MVLAKLQGVRERKRVIGVRMLYAVSRYTLTCSFGRVIRTEARRCSFGPICRVRYHFVESIRDLSALSEVLRRSS